MDVALELVGTYVANVRDLPPMPDVPVVVLMAERFSPARWKQRSEEFQPWSCEPRECHDRQVRLRIELLSGHAQEVTNGTFVLTTNVGHYIQREDPDLVIWAIRRVLDNLS